MRNIQPAPIGKGPLLERDYWAVLREPRDGPAELMTLLARHFTAFPPPSLVRFKHPDGDDAEAGNDGKGAGPREENEDRNGADDKFAERPLRVGDEIEIDIRLAGSCGVRVVHRDANSLTLATLEGHPEAGRITFGLYRDHRGNVVFHIRSRARAGSRIQLAGFLFAGDPMQTNTWSDFINRFAASVGDGVLGAIHAEKRTVDEEPGDRSLNGPTFVAQGD